MSCKYLWIWPEYCDPPHKLTHTNRYLDLLEKFQETGWGYNYPVVVGYNLDDHIQLISGTHRWYAALDAGIALPVALYDFDYINAIWGTDEWLSLLKNVAKVEDVLHIPAYHSDRTCSQGN